MKRLIIAALLAGAPLVAHSESFTFTTTLKPIDSVILPAASPGGRPEGAQLGVVTGLTTYADGHKETTTGKCAAWVLPPGSQFGSNGVCVYTESGAPLYTVQYTCDAPQPGAAGVSCWGRLNGQGGSWKGRTGVFGFFNGVDGTSRGSGQWN